MADTGATARGMERGGKTLVVCCDGTWMNSDRGWEEGGVFSQGHPQIPSNVTRIMRALKPETEDYRPQIAYYQSGMGTSWSRADKWLGGGLAFGLSENVREAYGFLAHNYQAHEEHLPQSDSIVLVGFSRGAFTARCVAGMIGCLGLLKKSAMRYFYPIFCDFENAGNGNYKPALTRWLPAFKLDVRAGETWQYLLAYRRELERLSITRPAKIKAIGVFDTVGSLGVPVTPWLQKLGLPTSLHTYRFFDTGIGDYVENAFQVLALDEQRAAFSPTIWEMPSPGTTNLKQVWMPGVHTSVGGGADDAAMPDLALAWMMSQLSPFLEFDEHYLLNLVDESRRRYEKRGASWVWGSGLLADSMTFPTNLTGSVIRTPASYRRINYTTGRVESAFLRNTGEKMHACVRARCLLGGKTWDGKPYASNSPALSGWVLATADGQGDKAVWRNQKQATLLEEDELGYFELLVLNRDPETKARLFGSVTGVEEDMV